MRLGTHADIRKALDDLFPKRQAYTDDNRVVFGTDPRASTRAIIDVPQSGRWRVEVLNGHRVKKTVELVVPSARPARRQLGPVVHFRFRASRRVLCGRKITKTLRWSKRVRQGLPTECSCRQCLWQILSAGPR